jgi:hypothetical protein
MSPAAMAGTACGKTAKGWSKDTRALMRLPLAVLTMNSPLRSVPLYKRM